jgi:hypothetical protein
MKFDTPATTNPIDQGKVIGQPTPRIEGPLKTTGQAPYAYEHHDAVPNQAYGVVVGSGIAKGRIATMNLAPAESAPGVIAIVTAANAGKLGQGKYNTARLLGGPEIQHYHQAVALVVAEPSNRPAPPQNGWRLPTQAQTVHSIWPAHAAQRWNPRSRWKTPCMGILKRRSRRHRCNWTPPTPRLTRPTR